MAFPTTVTTQINAYHGIGGPYVNSAGTAVYIFGRYAAAPEQVQAFKATDPSSTWVGVGTNPGVTSGNPIRQVAAYQYGDSIHVVTRDAAAANSNQLRYHLFNMATDTWTLTNELIKTTYTQAGPVDDSVVTIVARSAGAKFVSYEGPQVLADIQRARTYYARNLGTGWSADFALDGGGNSHWFPQETILGAADRVHFFLVNNTAEDLYQRTLDASNNLEALPAAFDTTTTNQSDEMVQRGVAYSASAGGTVVIVPYLNSFTPDINDVRFTSVDVPSPLTIRLDITNPQVPTGGLFRRNISFAADGNTVYSTFTNNSNNIYVQSSQDAGSWAAPGLLVGAATATEVYTNVFTRLGSRKLAVIYTRDNTDIKYTEYTLNIAPSVMTDRPDIFSASAQVRVSGSLSATAATDKFSATGYVIPVVKIGRLSATEAVDAFAGIGYVSYPTSIRFDNVAFTATPTAVNTFGLLLTATSNACLIVFVAGGDQQTVSSVAVGVNQLTRLGFIPNFSTRTLEAWVLTAPPAGILTISGTLAGVEFGAVAVGAVTYTGHKTTGTGPFGSVASGTAANAVAASLIVPSTAGNVVVFGFSYDFTPGVATAGYGLGQRGLTGNGEWPDILIADRVANGPNVTGTAFAAVATQWGQLGINLIQSGAGTTTGLGAFTDVPGTVSASGYLVVSGRMSATDAAGTLSATGYVKVTARLSATEAYTDAFAVSGTTITPVHGSVAWTMRQDTASINPRQPLGLTPMGPSNAGGGAGAKSPENTPWPTDLWDVREAYLLSLYPEGPHPAPELEDNAKAWQEYEDRKQQLVNLTAERAHAIVELRESPDVATMKACGAHIKELTAKIATLTGKQDFARFMRH